MKLTTPNAPEYTGEADVTRANIVDMLIQTTERKRSRPSSSLDVKVDYGAKLTTPPTRTEPPKMPRRGTAAAADRRMMPPPMKAGSTLFKPRARKGAREKFGPQKHQYDLSDLDGLTEEQLRMVFAQDPELAAAAAAAAEVEMNKSRKNYKGGPYYRTKDGDLRSIDDYPEHLKAMMDEGIPVKQWIILLILLGAGLYQLRKMMVGPPKAERMASRKSPSPKKARRTMGKQKGKKTSSPDKQSDGVRSAAAETKQTTLPFEEKPVAPDSGKEAMAAGADTKKPKASKKKRKTAKQKVQPKDNAKEQTLTADKEKHRQSPETTSTEASSTVDVVADSDDRGGAASAEQWTPEPVPEEPVEEDDGWKTVGGGSSSDKSQRKNGNKAKAATAAEPTKKDPVDTKDSAADTKDAAADTKDTAETKDAAEPKDSADNAETAPALSDDPEPEPDVSAKTAEVAPATTKKEKTTKKKKKKNKSSDDDRPTDTQQAETDVSAPPGFASTEDDEALAMKLQQEEERLAEALSRPAAEDTWAEVTPKKSKRRTVEAS